MWACFRSVMGLRCATGPGRVTGSLFLDRFSLLERRSPLMDAGSRRGRWPLNPLIKQRLVGTVVLVALGIVFWPLIFVTPESRDPIVLTTYPKSLLSTVHPSPAPGKLRGRRVARLAEIRRRPTPAHNWLLMKIRVPRLTPLGLRR